MDQIKANIRQSEAVDWRTVEEKNRGRKEIRHVAIHDQIQGIDPDWVGLKRIIYVRRSGRRKDTGSYDNEHYYITSLASDQADYLAKGIRGHWGIENRLHYVKDVHFGEDSRPIKVGQAAEVQSILQNIAINIFRDLGFHSIKKATIHFGNKIEKLSELINAHHIIKK